MPAKPLTGRQIAIACAKICDSKKAEDIVILDLRKQNYVIDFFVICTADNPRHSRAVANELASVMKQKNVKLYNTQGFEISGWIVQAYEDVWVHIFEKKLREYYDLEGLWADAKRIKWKR